MRTKLLGNPHPVPTAYGDASCGYSEEDKKSYEALALTDICIVEDVKKIVEACKFYNYEIEPHVAYYAWGEYSMQESAHWLQLPKSTAPDHEMNIFECIRNFLIVEIIND